MGLGFDFCEPLLLLEAASISLAWGGAYGPIDMRSPLTPASSQFSEVLSTDLQRAEPSRLGVFVNSTAAGWFGEIRFMRLYHNLRGWTRPLSIPASSLRKTSSLLSTCYSDCPPFHTSFEMHCLL